MIDGVQRYLNQIIDIANDHEYQWNHHDYFMEIHVVSLDFWGDLGYIYPTFKLALEQVAGSGGLQEERRIDESDGGAYTMSEFEEYFGGLGDEPGTFEANLLDETHPTLSGTNSDDYSDNSDDYSDDIDTITATTILRPGGPR